MPTYEYACRSCGSHLEIVQRFDDEPLSECPSCGGPVRKVFGSIGIAFKGSGFYKTDSRSSAKGDSAAPAKKAESASGGDGKEGSGSKGGGDTAAPSKTSAPAKSDSPAKTSPPAKTA